MLRFSLSIFLFITFCGCEKNAILSPKRSRFIASIHLQKIDGQENFSNGIKEFLSTEQNLTVHNSLQKVNPKYAPESNPKFPLPYYLIPEEDSNFITAESLDPRVADQLVMRISGKKHYKFFIHPDSEMHYDFLRSSYNYIGTDQTEFFSSPISNYHLLLVWNKNNSKRKPFIVKINVDKNDNEVERSIANQKVLDRIGEKKLQAINLKIFPETMGLTIDKIPPSSQVKLGGQVISEIPDEIINEEKKWLSFSILMSPHRKDRPFIIDVIKQSGLSSYDFFKTYMITSYLGMFDEITLKRGINFEPYPQNLILETTIDLKPTGKWVLQGTGGPDIFTMASYKGPVDIYMEDASAVKYKLRNGRTSCLRNYVFFYKTQIFDNMLTEVAKYDSSLTQDQIQNLKNDIDKKYTAMINSHLGLDLKNVPDISEYKNVEEIIMTQTEFNEKSAKKEIKETDNLKTFIEKKKIKKEWINLSVPKGKSEFYLTDHGLYEVSNKKIVGLALFSRNELDEYNTNSKMLINFKMQSYHSQDKTSCFGMATEILKSTKK